MRSAFVLVLASGCTAALADEAKKPKVDQKADDLLRKMSTTLAGTKAFQFDADHVLEVVTKDGERLQFLARSRVSLQRPDKLRSDRVGAVVDATLYYDGHNITIHGKRLNMYAQAVAPHNLDGAIDFARDTLGLEAPAEDVLYSDPYTGLMDDVTSGVYIGNEPIGDRNCHHLAFRAHDTDWQMWVEDSPKALPCRYVITSLDVPGVPEFTVAFSSWNLAPTFDAKHFEFTPPPGAKKIDFLTRKNAVANRSKP
jgi:hypothetical protein